MENKSQKLTKQMKMKSLFMEYMRMCMCMRMCM